MYRIIDFYHFHREKDALPVLQECPNNTHDNCCNVIQSNHATEINSDLLTFPTLWDFPNAAIIGDVLPH